LIAPFVRAAPFGAFPLAALRRAPSAGFRTALFARDSVARLLIGAATLVGCRVFLFTSTVSFGATAAGAFVRPARRAAAIGEAGTDAATAVWRRPVGAFAVRPAFLSTGAFLAPRSAETARVATLGDTLAAAALVTAAPALA
jgi:hypothetical protein